MKERKWTRVRGVALIGDGVPDSIGESILIDGVQFPPQILVTRGFDKSVITSRLGIAEVKREGDKLVFEFDLPTNRLPPFPIYPAISGSILKRGDRDPKVIEQCFIEQIGLSLTQNADKRIPPIEEVEQS